MLEQFRSNYGRLDHRLDSDSETAQKNLAVSESPEKAICFCGVIISLLTKVVSAPRMRQVLAHLRTSQVSCSRMQGDEV